MVISKRNGIQRGVKLSLEVGGAGGSLLELLIDRRWCSSNHKSSAKNSIGDWSIPANGRGRRNRDRGWYQGFRTDRYAFYPIDD